MNILITSPSLQEKGGVGRYYKSILPFLAKNPKFSVSLLEIGSRKRAHGMFYFIMDHIRFYARLKRRRFDLVVVNPSLNLKCCIRDGLFLHAARKFGIPVLVFMRGWNYSLEKWITGGLGFIFSRTLRKADAFVVLGSHFKSCLRLWGVRRPIYLDTTAVDQALVSGFNIEEKIRLLLKSDQLKLLFLARLERDKGLWETVRAFKALASSGLKITLTLAGDGPLYARLKRLPGCAAGHNGGRVLGYVDGPKKREVLVSHDVYCLPSYHEGMPNALLEAMACGLAVITCPVGGITDFFRQGVMGYLVEPRDTAALAVCFRKLYGDRSKLAEMARYNHRYARQKFLAPAVARRLGAILESTAKKDRK